MPLYCITLIMDAFILYYTPIISLLSGPMHLNCWFKKYLLSIFYHLIHFGVRILSRDYLKVFTECFFFLYEVYTVDGVPLYDVFYRCCKMCMNIKTLFQLYRCSISVGCIYLNFVHLVFQFFNV